MEESPVNRLQAAARIFGLTVAIISSLTLWNSFSVKALAQYSDNLREIYAPSQFDLYFHPPTPIGDLGNIETVVDLRGFVPMSLPKRPDSTLGKVIHWNEHEDHWYKIPTKKALLILYYGTLNFDKVADDATTLEAPFKNVPFLKESQAHGETASWVRLAYTLDKEAPQLYEQLIGGGGYEGSEATTLFFTEQSAFVVLSLRYSSTFTLNGQLLIALEFSRFSKNYKALYKLSSTTLMVNKSSSEALTATAPFIAKAITAALQ
jgi:hypothetical protein